MKRNPGIINNVGWLTLDFFFGRGASQIWQLLLARFLSNRAEIYGQFGVLLSLLAIFMILAEFGLNLTAQQEWPKKELTSRMLLGLLGLLRSLTGGVSSLSFIVTIYLLYGLSDLFLASIPMGISLFAYGQMQSPIGVWESRQEMRFVGILGMIQAAILIPAQLLALQYWGTLFALSAAFALSSVSAASFAWAFAIKLWGFPSLPMNRDRNDLLKRYLSLGLPVMFSAITFVLYYRIDSVLLSKWVSNEAAGVLVIATLLFFGMVDMTWTQVGRVIFPRLSHAWNAKVDLSDIYNKILFLMKFYMLLSIFILMFGLTLGQPAFMIVFGSDSPWVRAWAPLMILLLAFWPLVIYGLVYRILLLERKRYWYTGVVGVATITKFGLVLYLIPLMGPTGAALSNYLSQLVMAFLTLLGLRELWKKVVTWKLVGQYASLMAVVIVGWWLTSQWHWEISLLIQMALVGGMIIVTGLFDVFREGYRRFLDFLRWRSSS